MREREWDFAGCPACMDGPSIEEGHAYCQYPSANWQELWDEGEADVVLIDSTWYVFRKGDDEVLAYLQGR